MSIALLESQPNFPTEDITKETAEVLEFWLQNKEILSSTHEQTKVFYLYRLGHAALERTVRDSLSDAQRAAFSHGISAFEVTAALVKPAFGPKIDAQTATLHIASTQQELRHSFARTVIDARDTFIEQMPHTCAAIGESALRFYRNHSDYVISGAAIARELEIGALAA